MKIAALICLTAVLAFSNCEPVEYAGNQSGSSPKVLPKTTPSAAVKAARVVGISDGDSIVVLFEGNKRQRVRLATIDAPEKHQDFGNTSKQSLSDLIYNKEIRIDEVDTDQYGRMVAEVYIGETNVNLEQIRRGLAWHYKAHARQQNPTQRDQYAAAEIEARSKKRGLWQNSNPTPPWEYRKQNPRNEK